MASVDPNVAVLKGITDKFLNELPEKQKNITKEILSQAMSKIFVGIVDMFHTINNDLKDSVAELKQENKELKNLLMQTNVKHEQLQQYINRDTLKMCNIKEPTLGPNDTENVNDTVVKTLEAAGIAIRPEEISVCHRLPVSKESKLKHKSIIVKFVRREVRNEVIKKKKEKMKDNVEFQRLHPDAFMTEHLTPLRSKAAFEIRNDPEIEKMWTMDGRMKILKKDRVPDSKPINITSLSDLTEIGWSHEKIEKLVLSK